MAETKLTFETDDADDGRLDAEAMAEYRAGRFVTHAEATLNEDVWAEPALAHLRAIPACISLVSGCPRVTGQTACSVL